MTIKTISQVRNNPKEKTVHFGGLKGQATRQKYMEMTYTTSKFLTQFGMSLAFTNLPLITQPIRTAMSRRYLCLVISIYVLHDTRSHLRPVYYTRRNLLRSLLSLRRRLVVDCSPSTQTQDLTHEDCLISTGRVRRHAIKRSCSERLRFRWSFIGRVFRSRFDR